MTHCSCPQWVEKRVDHHLNATKILAPNKLQHSAIFQARLITLQSLRIPLPPSASLLSAKHGMFTVVVIWIPVLTANPMSDVTNDPPTKLKKHQQSPGARPERATNPDSDSGKGRQTLHPGRPNCTGEHFCFGNRCQCLGNLTIICFYTNPKSKF